MSTLFSIRASAGSGKTHHLASRFLEKLAEVYQSAGGLPVREKRNGCALISSGSDSRSWSDVMAVTFTNAAAQEMKARVLCRLKEIALGLDNNPASSCGWNRESALAAVDDLLRRFDDLNLRTIDSLLHFIVRQAALELGLPPGFETTFDDNDLFGPIIDDLAEEARDGDEELAGLFRKSCQDRLSYGHVKGFLAGTKIRETLSELAGWMLAQQDSYGDLRGLADAELSERIDEVQRDMLNEVLQTADRLKEEFEQSGVTDKRFLNALNSVGAKLDLHTPSTIFDITSVYLHQYREIKNASEADMADLARFRDTLAAVKAAVSVFQYAQQLTPFIMLAVKILDRLPEYQARAALLPASRVPALAAKVLNRDYGVSEAFCRMGSRLEHILIDEFQDTSLTQWQAMQPLAVEVLSRGGTVSLIGDVKQSIYHWRGGDSSLFDKVPEGLQARGLAEVDRNTALGANWRSRRNIIEWNNAFFSQLADTDTARAALDRLVPEQKDKFATLEPERQNLLKEEALLLSGAFADAVQHFSPHTEEGGLIEVVRLSSSAPDEEEEEEESSADDPLKKWLQEKVREIVGRTGSFRSVGVLTHTTKECGTAARWLMQAGIPVLTKASLLLAEQPVIVQTVAFMTFLTEQDDDIAFWNVLEGDELLPPAPAICWGGEVPSSPQEFFFGWAAGQDLKRAEEVRRWKEEGHDDLPPRQPLSRLFAEDFPELWQYWFEPLTSSEGLYTPYDTICGLYRRWHVWERCRSEQGFLRRFLEILHMAEQEGLADMGAFLQWWEEKGGEEKAPLPKTLDAVQVSTIHSAKGLAFDAVIVPWMNVNLIKRARDYLAPPCICQAGGLTVLSRRVRMLGKEWLEAMLDRAREELHLLYVACTRARHELHCVLPPEGSSSGMAEVLDMLSEKLLADMEEYRSGCWRKGSVSYDRNRPAAELPTEEPELPPEEVPAPLFPAEAWLPMNWLPRLCIFHSPLDEWAGWKAPDSGGEALSEEEATADNGGFAISPRQRGVLAHLCLQLLQEGGEDALSGDEQSLKERAAHAVRRALLRFPLPLRDTEKLEKELEDMLLWYASLPECAHWLRYGVPEQSLLDAEGKVRRSDLLVEDDNSLVVVEYKSGGGTFLPVAAHVRQVKEYMEALEAEEDKPVYGALVYLDCKKIFHFKGALS